MHVQLVVSANWRTRRVLPLHKICKGMKHGMKTYMSSDLWKTALKTYEPRHEKTNILVSDLFRHKPGCTATEDG